MKGSVVIACDNLSGASGSCLLSQINFNRLSLSKNDAFYGWVIFWVIGPLVANANKSALLVRDILSFQGFRRTVHGSDFWLNSFTLGEE